EYELELNAWLRSFLDPTAPYWPHRAEDNRWLPEDLTTEIWAGHNFFRLDEVAMGLREHEIPYSVEAESLSAVKLLVHPEDAEYAQKVLRDLENGPESE